MVIVERGGGWSGGEQADTVRYVRSVQVRFNVRVSGPTYRGDFRRLASRVESSVRRKSETCT